jgi:hypothetical protein
MKLQSINMNLKEINKNPSQRLASATIIGLSGGLCVSYVYSFISANLIVTYFSYFSATENRKVTKLLLEKIEALEVLLKS